MSNKKKHAKQTDNLTIKGSFDDVIGVTVGVQPKSNSQPPKTPKVIPNKKKTN